MEAERLPSRRASASGTRFGFRRLVAWLERVGSTRAGFAVFAGFAVVYLATAAYSTTQSVDTIAAAVPAWQLVENGTLRVDEFREATPWFVTTPDGVYSNRFPGVIFIAVPLYALASLLGFSGGASPTLVPAGMTAALVTAAAMGVLFVVFSRLAPPTIALVAVLVVGLGTGTWSVSGHALWTHGPAQLYLALAMFSLAREKYASTGAALAFAVFTRPQLAMVPLAIGIRDTVRLRSARPAIVIGLLSAAGLAALLAYNAIVFGEPSITGGYAPYAAENLTGMGIGSYLMNWLMTLVSPTRGLLLFSPFLLAAVPKIRTAWREAPGWVRSSAVAGGLYMALQLRVNAWSGGDTFLGYRLAIEMVTLLAPLLLISTRLWVGDYRGRRIAFSLAVAWAVALQAFGATAYLPLATRA